MEHVFRNWLVHVPFTEEWNKRVETNAKIAHCKGLVMQFEKCLLICRDKDNRDGGCPTLKKQLVEDCDEFRPKWEEWWIDELKPKHCSFLLDGYNNCLKRFKEGRRKSDEPCHSIYKYRQYCGCVEN